MMKRIIVLILISVAITLNGYAQRVYKEGNMVILDCTQAAGAPKGASTTDPKCVTVPGENASNTTYRDGTIMINPYAWEQDRVYLKLEIDKVHTPTIAGGTAYAMSWMEAYNRCKDKNTENSTTGWRLPTQRELSLIYIFLTPIITLSKSLGGSSVFANVYYWSSSESSPSSAAGITLSTGNRSNTLSKKSVYRARCVREVTP